jgi:hypothetical protein
MMMCRLHVQHQIHHRQSTARSVTQAKGRHRPCVREPTLCSCAMMPVPLTKGSNFKKVDSRHSHDAVSARGGERTAKLRTAR